MCVRCASAGDDGPPQARPVRRYACLFLDLGHRGVAPDDFLRTLRENPRCAREALRCSRVVPGGSGRCTRRDWGGDGGPPQARGVRFKMIPLFIHAHTAYDHEVRKNSNQPLPTHTSGGG